MEPPERLDDQQLVRELSDLVLRYLIKPRRSRKSQRLAKSFSE